MAYTYINTAGVIQQFIECTSLSISYDIMGIATVSYTIVFQTDGADPPMIYAEPIDAGGRTYSGYLSSISINRIPETENWYESQVSLIATTEDG